MRIGDASGARHRVLSLHRVRLPMAGTYLKVTQKMKILEPDLTSATLHILSLGAGVQSTTMALMAAHGEIEPMPDCAIFADTQAEPASVYDHLNWLRSPNVLPFPVEVVTAGDLGAKVMGGGYSDVPFYTERGPGRRQCTKAFKLNPIRDKAKEWAGVPIGEPSRLKPGTISMWIGISLDELIRVKPSRIGYIENRWPLVERRMSRNDCHRWLSQHSYPDPPRSACVFCPYRKNDEWRDLSAGDWAQAVKVDEAIRKGGTGTLEQYVHRTLMPLSAVDLSTPEDRGQGVLFGDECEGMCGV
jgi:hypothetical protein